MRSARVSNRKKKDSKNTHGVKKCLVSRLAEIEQNDGFDDHSVEYITSLLREIKTVGADSEIFDTVLEHSLATFKLFINNMQLKDKRSRCQSEKLLLLDIANWFFSFLTTRTKLNIYEEATESFLKSIKGFFFSKVFNEQVENMNSKKAKLHPNDINDKIVNGLLTFYEILPDLVKKNTFTEFGIHEVLSCSFFILSSEIHEALNVKAIKVVSEVFSICEWARANILDDISLLLKKQVLSNQRNYFSVDNEHKVLLITALLLSLFQSIPHVTEDHVIPNQQVTTKRHQRRPRRAKKSPYKDARIDHIGSYRSYLVLCQPILMNIFIGCSSSEGRFKTDQFFIEFLDNIISLADHIQWPSAHLFIMTCYQILMKFITDKSKEVSLRVTSCHCIGKIYKFLSSYVCSPKEIVEGTADDCKFSIDSYRTVILKCLVHAGDKNACNFHVSQWRYIDSLMNKQSDKNEFDEGLNGKFDDRYKLPADALKQMYRILSSTTWCFKVHDLLTKYMFQLASDDAVAIRLNVIQYLGHFAVLNSNFAKQETFVDLIHTRVKDSAPSVRSSAIEVIGRITCKFECSIDLFFEDLSTCCSDVSITVRKQAIMALKDFLLNPGIVNCLEHSLAPDMMLCLLNRISDEEQVKKHVLDVFSKLISPSDVSTVFGCFRKIIEKYPSQATLTSLEIYFQSLLRIGDSKVVRKDSIDRGLKAVVHKGIETFLADCHMFKKSGMTGSIQKEMSSCSLLLKIWSSLEVHDCFLDYIDDFIECCILQFPDEFEASLKSDLLCILSNCLASASSLQESSKSRLQDILLRFLTFPSIKVIEKSLMCIETMMSKGMFEIMPLRDLFTAMIECLTLNIENDHGECTVYKETTTASSQKNMTSLLIVGMFSKYFDQSQLRVQRSKIFECFIHYAQSMDDDVRLRGLYGLGYFLQRNSDLLLDDRLIQLMLKIFKSPLVTPPAVICVLRYLGHYFTDHDLNYVGQHDGGCLTSLKEPYENDSSSTSQIAQIFLEPLLNNFLNCNSAIRESSFDIVSSILHQGLIHPAMCLPHLICASSAPRDQHLCCKADRLLRMIHTKYPSLIAPSTMLGLRLSYQLNVALETPGNKIIRGYKDANGKLFSCLDTLFSFVNNSNVHYHSFVNCLMKCFSTSPTVNSQDCGICELLFLSDALSCFPFTSMESICYLLKCINMALSNLGPGVLEEFSQILNLNQNPKRKKRKKKSTSRKKRYEKNHRSSVGKVNKDGVDKHEHIESGDENYDDTCISYTREEIQNIIKNLPANNFKRLEDICLSAHKCLLLIYLKDHFQKLFNINDRNLLDYLSRGCKTFASAHLVHPKVSAPFDPKLIISVIRSEDNVETLIDCFSELNNHFGGEIKFEI